MVFNITLLLVSNVGFCSDLTSKLTLCICDCGNTERACGWCRSGVRAVPQVVSTLELLCHYWRDTRVIYLTRCDTRIPITAHIGSSLTDQNNSWLQSMTSLGAHSSWCYICRIHSRTLLKNRFQYSLKYLTQNYFPYTYLRSEGFLLPVVL